VTDVERRLREALETVASTTEIAPRPEAIVWQSGPERRRWTVAAAAFIATLLAVGVPAVFLASTDRDPFPVVSDVPEGIDPGWLLVEPDDLAVLDALRAETGPGGERPGPRRSLISERVWCLYPTSPGSEVSVSERISLVEDIKVDVLVEVCTQTDTTPALPGTPTVCRGVYAESAYDAWVESGEIIIPEGPTGAAAPGFPVVLGWESDCVSEQLATNPQVTLTADLSLDLVNLVRHLEIAVTGAAYRNCLTSAQAGALAEAARDRLGDGWILGRSGMAPSQSGTDCYRPVVDLQFGAVYVLERRLFEEHESARTPDLGTGAPVTTIGVDGR